MKRAKGLSDLILEALKSTLETEASSHPDRLKIGEALERHAAKRGAWPCPQCGLDGPFEVHRSVAVWWRNCSHVEGATWKT